MTTARQVAARRLIDILFEKDAPDDAVEAAATGVTPAELRAAAAATTLVDPTDHHRAVAADPVAHLAARRAVRQQRLTDEQAERRGLLGLLTKGLVDQQPLTAAEVRRLAAVLFGLRDDD